MGEIIAARGLAKMYGQTRVVDDVTFSVSAGTVFGLLGANGAGKTTTIECLLGVRKPDSGTVSLLGMNPATDRKTVFESVGVQFQEARYQDKIKVSELCHMTQALYRSAADYVALLEQFGLHDKQDMFVEELSGGQRQRLFIVLALIPSPEIVFLDELTTGLDVKARRETWRHLEGLKQRGLTIVLTSHFMDEVEILCDRVAIMRQGRIAFAGTVAEVVASGPFATLEEAYLYYAEGETNESE